MAIASCSTPGSIYAASKVPALAKHATRRMIVWRSRSVSVHRLSRLMSVIAQQYRWRW